jgi:hypothetical protein
MVRSLVWGALGAFASLSPVFSDTFINASHPYVLAATDDAHSYGLWLAAPQHGCRSVRYVVTAHGARLGFTGPLGPGEGAVVRIGRGFVQGEHALAITGVGCGAPPAEARRVRLGKSSPDHAWRAP